MNDEQIWDDESRNELRQRLQSAILGELRLAKYGYEDLLQKCLEVYIEDECPEGEIRSFIQFTADELDWDGNYARKIGVSLNWQRRTLIE
jgi:hypothetical protein